MEHRLQGLGGPINVEQPNLAAIDPTLDACCRRDAEDQARGSALRRTLAQHDRIAKTERARRNLVVTGTFEGCRCCYDPNADGTGDYRALIELKQQRQRNVEASGEEEEVVENKKAISSSDDDDEDSDDEFDYLLNDDLPSSSEWELARRAELEMAVMDRDLARQHGYGVHRQLHPTRVLKAAGLGDIGGQVPPAAVIHLVDPDSRLSAELDLYLEELASATPGTKFVRAGGRSTLLMDSALAAKVLPRLQPDRDMPALVAVKDGVVVNQCPLAAFGRESLEESAVRDWLDRSGVLLTQLPMVEEVCRIRPEEEALMDYLSHQVKQPDPESVFHCGVDGCNKDYAHEHIGIANEEQTGLVVSERDILGNEG